MNLLESIKTPLLLWCI